MVEVGARLRFDGMDEVQKVEVVQKVVIGQGHVIYSRNRNPELRSPKHA